MSNPLLDTQFLLELDKTKHKEVFAKIVALNFFEQPVETIEGVTTGGTVNFDGASAVRRTCNLTIAPWDIDIHEYYWGKNVKFKLYMGLRNNIDTSYDDIIWFKMGVFVITDFKFQDAYNNYTITVTGKDKMCLLNGDCGGTLTESRDFGKEYFEHEDGSRTEYYPTIRTIIRNSVHQYGNEPFHNIIINDVDDTALQTIDFAGKDYIYLLRYANGVDKGTYGNILFDGDITRYLSPDSGGGKVILSKLEEIPGCYYYNLAPNADNTHATKIKNSDSINDTQYYYVVRCSSGEAVGYRTTDLTWFGKDGLVGNVGSTMTAIYDRIIKTFSEYEYFYDIDGRFVFQRKPTYINKSWNNIIKVEDDETYVESAKTVSEYSYSFNDATLIQSFQNAPKLTNMRNDYSVWGKRNEGSDAHVHLRCAICEKPTSYTQITVSQYDVAKWREKDVNFFQDLTEEAILNFAQEEPKTYTTEDWDYREVIYQMAKDYFKYNHLDDFERRVAQANPQYHYGRTGYEQFYTDLEEFWRGLYNPAPTDEKKENYFCKDDTDLIPEYLYWNRQVYSDPATLIFWFELFGDTDAEYSKYSVTAIGNRAKAVEDDNIHVVVYNDIPDLIYITQDKYEELKKLGMLQTGYSYVLLPDGFEEYFQVTARNKSAQQTLDDLLYQYTFCSDQITIKAVPVYYLEPNTKIFVYDEKSGINGEYIIKKISYNLQYSGLMTITATKAPKRLY